MKMQEFKNRSCRHGPPRIEQTKFILTAWTSKLEIRNMKLHEENKLCTMQNNKTVREPLSGRIEKVRCSEAGELKNYERTNFPDKNNRKVSQQTFGAALRYPTFPVILYLFRILWDCLAAILACGLTYGTHLVHRETFLKSLCTR